MFSYIFVLGKASDLCRSELETVLNQKKINFNKIYSSDQIYHLEIDKPLDTTLIQKLGGTIKIAKVIGQTESIDDLTNVISHYFKNTSDKKITFGLSLYGQNKISTRNLLDTAKEIKKNLKDDAYSCRFVLPTEDNILSSVQVTKHKVQEVIICFENDEFFLAVTEAVQNFEDWNKRDYSRPMSDPKSGMLPPKVARMMVNLANRGNSDQTVKTILDPFCGMGTILQEGLSLGFKVIGSDQDDQVVAKAKTNMEWFCGNFQTETSNCQVFVARAEHISQYLSIGFLADVIVTEPYLGPNILPLSGIENIIDGLFRLYVGCFNDWKNILRDNGLIVIALPSFFINNQEYFVRGAIDKILKLGYSIETGPLPYYRPQAVVRRNVYVFKKI